MVRLRIFTITTLLGILIINCYAQQNNARSYDTNDWIPVSRPRFQNEDSSVENDDTQKRPTGRVLNLPAPDQKRFFPTESGSNTQPYRVPLNTNLQGNQQPKLEQFQLPPKYQQELTTYVPSPKQQQQQQKQQQLQQKQQQLQQKQQQQQILLPPQLQSIINQNQPLLSPQRINSQLLQQPYLNASEFNSKDVVQNINLGLYKHQQNVKPTLEPEEVQLLYVPLENLRQRGQRQQIQFPQGQVLPSQHFYNQPYQQHKQIQLQNIQHDFAQQALQAQKLQEQFSHNIEPVAQQQYRRPYHDSAPQSTTSVPVPAPKKRKPHQPPLAVYMGTEGHATRIEIDDVLSLLKDAKSISVQDNVGPASPQVFVGPSHLEAPDGYVKFDLPYLSSIESNRVERKVDQLPFFVAPLSYKAPPGYSKIPFPAPHVGSVVINHFKAQEQQQREQQQQEVTSRRPQRVYEEENYSGERPAVKTRGRQRQPSRNAYTASTIETPVSAEIPYGPLPTKSQHHTIQESLVSLNPYGPTQFVQTTTPAIYEKPASLHEQIFSTKNRFATPSAYVQNSAVRQNQYQHHTSTEPTSSSSTLSGSISNDKYTVLEEFSITKKPQNKYQESQPERISLRDHQRRPTENYYSQDAQIKEALPLVSSLQPTNQQYLEPESHPTFTQKHEQKEYIPTQVPTQLEYETPQPIIQNTPSQLYEQRPQEQQVFTQTQQSNVAFELPQRHQQHTQTKQSETGQTIDKYEIPQRHHTPTQQTNNAYEEPLRQIHHQTSTAKTLIQQENDAYAVPKHQPHHTQNQQTNDAYDEPQQQHLVQHLTQTQPTNAVYEIPQRHSKRPQLEQQLNPVQIQQNSNEYEVPQRQRIQETSTRSQIQHSSNEYEIPQRHHQRPQLEQKLNVAQQSSNAYVAPQRQRHQETTTRAQTRFRGQQHFTPDEYSKEEYDYAAINDKTTEHNTINQQYDTHKTPRQEVTQLQFDPDYYRPQQVESQVTVTREPVVEYHLPIQSTSAPQFIPGAYYSEESVPLGPSSHEYTLPKQLPPISPQLPGLVNSLQDQALRPLLAPLLLPTSEDPIHEITSEYYQISSSTTTTTTTPIPIIEPTTKRNRGRQRATRPTTSYDYSNTTPNPTSRRQQSSYRGRRPYNGRVRPEYTKQVNDDNVQISSTSIPEITEGTTRSVYGRNRPVVQRYTTEQPRRTPASTRPRFRTRGRPVKDDEYSERSTTEHTSTFRLPEFEGGFQASVPMIQPTVHPDDVHHVLIHQPRQDQSLVYVQNKPVLQESSPISTEQYLPNRFGSSTESLEAVHISTLGISGPENNIVSDVIHNEPTVLINSNSNPGHVKYDSREQLDIKPNTRFETQEQNDPKTSIYDSKEEIDNKSNIRFDYREQGDTKSNIRFDSREQSDIKPNVYQSHVETNIPNSRYEEPEVKIEPTTELTRTRTRIRGRPRVRIQTTTRYQPSTTQRTTTESQEESKEFYGFFREPNFAKPIQMEYKQASELRTPARPTIAYIRQSEDQDGYSTPHSYIPQIEDNYAEHNIQSQYVSSTLLPTSEENVDIKPVTRRPISSFARSRRPTGPLKVEISSEAPVRSDKYFTRGTKRPEAEIQKATRIRGRIRKPIRPTTASSDSSESSERYQYTHSPRTHELANSNSAENAAPVKTRSRFSNRGKSHFQSPTGEKVEPESNNYPPSYLQAQQSQHHDSNYPVVSSTQQSIQVVNPQDINTPRPSFQLTIEPEEVPDEYLDQIPYSSVNRPKVASVELDEGEESKFSAKVVEKPSNFNYIIGNEKSSAKVEEITKRGNGTEISTVPGIIKEKTEETKDVIQQVTTPVIEAETSQSSETTTELPTTTMDATTEQQKRKGFWRLVNFRPLEDEFESAESQRVGTVFSNEFTTEEKHNRKYHSVKRIRTTEPPLEETTTTLPETTINPQLEVTHKQVDNAERDMFANLYEMFGFSPETSDANHNGESIAEPEVITTGVPTEKSPGEVEITTISSLNSTDSSSIEKLESSESSEDSLERDEAWHTRIIGTSTTTEISHETEICYRGRCIKSMTSEENSESL